MDGKKNNTSAVSKETQSDLSFLCFGGLDWWYQHRSHIDFQLARRFAQRGITLYINSIVMQKPKIQQGRKFLKKVVRKTKSIFTGLKMSDAGFWVYSPFSLPLHHRPWAKALNEVLLKVQLKRVCRKVKIKEPVVMVVCPTACDLALQMPKKRLIYLRTDAYELFPHVDVDLVQRCDRALKEASDLTLYVSEKLYREEADQCKRALYLDHGVDYDMFACSDNGHSIPADMHALKKPIIGFFGTLDKHTVDVEFVAQVADRLSDMSFVFVGKVNDRYDCLLDRRNIWLLGQKAYEEVPSYGECFDVAMMPWQQTNWISVCNPVKLKEYLALGKPVVSTPFPELQKYHDVVYQARTPEDFAECIRTALAEDNEDRIAARRGKVMKATWDQKAEWMLSELYWSDRSGERDETAPSDGQPPIRISSLPDKRRDTEMESHLVRDDRE